MSEIFPRQIFKYEILDLNRVQIDIPANLTKVKIEERKINKDKIQYIAMRFPPIVLCQEEFHYVLLGGALSYKLLVLNGSTQMLFGVYQPQGDHDMYVKEVEPKERKQIEAMILSVTKAKGKGTIYRHKAMESKRRCPYCADALMAPRKNDRPDSKGHYMTHCYNSKQGRCDFSLSITTYEKKERFERYKFDIDDFFIPIPGEICPKCNRELYLRIYHISELEILYFKICRNRISTKVSCDYAVKLKVRPEWLKK